jgi:2-oxoglutarate ferredoxin oxidoreductase subunit beta
MSDTQFDVNKYIRAQFFPHMWCPGCGHGTVMGCLLRAIHDLGLDNNDVSVVSGI